MKKEEFIRQLEYLLQDIQEDERCHRLLQRLSGGGRSGERGRGSGRIRKPGTDCFDDPHGTFRRYGRRGRIYR